MQWHSFRFEYETGEMMMGRIAEAFENPTAFIYRTGRKVTDNRLADPNKEVKTLKTVVGQEKKERLSSPENWVDQHGDYLFRYALLRLRNREVAEEVVQETFLAALQARDKFNGQSSEKTWLVGILKHKVIDHFRRTSKEVHLEDIDVLPCEREEAFRATGEWKGHWTDKRLPSNGGIIQLNCWRKKNFA